MNQALKQTPSLRDRIVEVLREHHEVKHIGELANKLTASLPDVSQLQAIAIAAQAYVDAVSGEPEKDCWATEDGKEVPGAEKFASDWAWQAYDQAKQKAFDALHGTLSEWVQDVAGLSQWEGWDGSRGFWSQTKHRDAVMHAMFRGPWSMEDAAMLLGFIDRTWPQAPAKDEGA